MAGLLVEMKRRNVFRVAIAYLVFAWLVLQVSDLLLPLFGAPGWVLRVIVLVVALGFVSAVVFSWVYELTPEGLKRESAVDRSRSITGETARKLDLIVIAMLVITVPFSIWALSLDRNNAGGTVTSTPASESAGSVNSVAVLPFVNMSGVAENEYFSDGLTETLLHMLAQVDRLKVAARTSSFAFKGKDIDIRDVASQLGVNHVLEGSVQRSGDRVRITAQLIDAKDGSHLWSENFDRKLDDIFVIQDEIAKSVAERLLDELLPNESVAHPDTDNTLAYDLYLRAQEENRKGNFAAFDRANAQLRQALVLDPDFTDARIELALNLYNQFSWGKAPPEFIHRAIEMLEDIEQDAGGHPRAAAYRQVMEGHRDAAVVGTGTETELLERLIEIVRQFPRDELLNDRLVFAYIRQDRPADALREIDRILEHDPMNGRLHDLRGRAYELKIEQELDLQWLDEARASYRRAVELSPESASTLARLAGVEAKYGSVHDFLDIQMQAFRADPNDPELPVSAAHMLYAIGETQGADIFAEWARAIDPAAPVIYKLPINRAMYTGDMRALFDASKRVFDDRVPNRWGVQADAIFGIGVAGIDLGRIDDTVAILDEARDMPVFRPFLPLVEVIRLYVLVEVDDRQRFIAERDAAIARLEAGFGSIEDVPSGLHALLVLVTDDPADDLALDEVIMSMGPGYRHQQQVTIEELTKFPVVQRRIDVSPNLATELDRLAAERETMRQEAHRFFVDRGLIEESL